MQTKTEDQIQAELIEKLEREQWLALPATQAFLRGITDKQKQLHIRAENLVEIDDAFVLSMLTKETQTLTKVLNYARRSNYSTDTSLK